MHRILWVRMRSLGEAMGRGGEHMPGIPFFKALPALLQIVPDNIYKVCFSLEGCTAGL